MESLQGERSVFYARLCKKADKWPTQHWPCKGFLQAATTAAMHCQPEKCTHPPPPVPPFLLAQNLSSKRIAPTDNMQSKSQLQISSSNAHSTFFTFAGKIGNIFHPSPKVASSEGSSSEMLLDSNSTGIPSSQPSVVAPLAVYFCLTYCKNTQQVTVMTNM